MDNSGGTVNNGSMALVPALRVVPLSRVMRHEEVDPLRVEQLRTRMEAEGVQRNPVICAEVGGDGFVVLDGATRTEALRQLGMEWVVVQVVDPTRVTLETWHHVIRNCQSSEVIAQIGSHPEIILSEAGGTPRVTTADGTVVSVLGNGMSPNATMSALVASYIGRWTASRIIDPSPDTVAWRFPDWSVVVEFPPVEIEEVIKAALGGDLLPAGVTRFLVPERVLRLNAELGLLDNSGSLTLRQAALDALIQMRSRAGRIRRYEETVIVLDD